MLPLFIEIQLISCFKMLKFKKKAFSAFIHFVSQIIAIFSPFLATCELNTPHSLIVSLSCHYVWDWVKSLRLPTATAVLSTPGKRDVCVHACAACVCVFSVSAVCTSVLLCACVALANEVQPRDLSHLKAAALLSKRGALT